MKKNFTLIALLVLIAFSKPVTTIAQVNLQDSLALVDLYDSTDGANWTHHDNWLTSQPVSTWYGVEVNNNRVTYLGFYSGYKSAANNMVGRLPHSINNLTELTGLILAQNQLTGNIPSLKKLDELWLNNNQLSGTLPDTIFDPLKFGEIFLDHNNLSGNVPYTFANYYVSTVELEYNHLTGFAAFPDSFNVSHYEVSIDLSYNNLTDLLPFKAIANYRELFLEHNQLTGIAAIPGNYHTSSIGLSQLDVSYNNLTGIIPYYIMKLPQIYELNLSHNQLSGQIPAFAVGFHGAQLDLSYNLLTGHIPPSIGNADIETLNLSNNKLSGTIPASISNMTGLTKLILNNNKLTGSISKELGRLYRYFKYLYLNNNKLSGTIPDSLGYAAHLYDLDLSNNQLSGLIPSKLGYLKLLYQLNLNDNNLSGRIPSTFSNFYRIDTLRLQNNQLSGTVPDLGVLARMRDLSLRSNNFTFNGLEAIQQEYGSTALYYAQATIPLHQHTNTLAVTAGGTLSNNTYTWHKDGTVYATHTGDSTLPITANGSYYVSVTNSIATQLTLYSDTLTVSGFSKPAATIALYPNPAKSNATALFNATGKYMVELTNASGKVLQTISGTSNKVQNKVDFNISSYPSGMYFITI